MKILIGLVALVGTVYGSCDFCSDQKNIPLSIPLNKKVGVCDLGVKTGQIPNNRITASSYWSDHHRHEPWDGRLDSPSDANSAACWAPKGKDFDPDPWIQVDFGEQVTIAGVVTQGRPTEYNQWMTSYEVAYGDNPEKLFRVRENCEIKVFEGNTDRHSHAVRMFPRAVKARYARIYPKSDNKKTTATGGLCLRFDFLGC